MSKEINGNVADPRFWTSRKFWLTVLGAGVFLTLALTGTTTFTNTEVIVVILSLVLGNVTAHTATDITSMITRVLALRGGNIDVNGILEAISNLAPQQDHDDDEKDTGKSGDPK